MKRRSIDQKNAHGIVSRDAVQGDGKQGTFASEERTKPRRMADALIKNVHEMAYLATGIILVASGVIGEATEAFALPHGVTGAFIGVGFMTIIAHQLIQKAGSSEQSAKTQRALRMLSETIETRHSSLQRDLATIRAERSAREFSAQNVPEWFRDNVATWSCVREMLRTYKARWLGECAIDALGRAIISGERLRAIADVRMDAKTPIEWEIGCYIPPTDAIVHPGVTRNATRTIAMIAGIQHKALENPQRYSTDNIRILVSDKPETKAVSFSLTRFAAKGNMPVAISYNADVETDLCETFGSAPRRVLVDPTSDRIADFENAWARFKSGAANLSVDEFLDRYRDRLSAGAEVLELSGHDEVVSYPDGFTIHQASRRIEIVAARPQANARRAKEGDGEEDSDQKAG